MISKTKSTIAERFTLKIAIDLEIRREGLGEWIAEVGGPDGVEASGPSRFRAIHAALELVLPKLRERLAKDALVRDDDHEVVKDLAYREPLPAALPKPGPDPVPLEPVYEPEKP